MTTLGYVLILLSVLVTHAVIKGRALTDVPADLADMFTAAVQGDTAAMGAVFNRTGEGQTPVATDVVSLLNSSTGGGSALLAECQRIGKGKPYVWGASGPDAYDCSGLVWAAMTNLKYIAGPRFTTISFPSACASVVDKLNSVQPPAVGDVVLWPEHMGVVDGVGTFYSAMNPKDGIKSSSIDGFGPGYSYYRLHQDLTKVVP